MTAALRKITYLRWKPLEVPGRSVEDAMSITSRLEQVIAPWINTPFMKGQQGVGQGVDCLRLLTAIFDELYRGRPRPIPNVAQDASLHNRPLVWGVMRAIIQAYGLTSVKLLRPTKPEDPIATVEPGDVIATGPLKGGPGHAILVAGNPSTMVHAANRCVSRTGMAVIGQRVFRIFRPMDKERWL